MHPEEKWLPGKVAKGFKPGDKAEVTLQDDTVSTIDFMNVPRAAGKSDRAHEIATRSSSLISGCPA
jgi:hypothetical protein